MSHPNGTFKLTAGTRTPVRVGGLLVDADDGSVGQPRSAPASRPLPAVHLAPAAAPRRVGPAFWLLAVVSLLVVARAARR